MPTSHFIKAEIIVNGCALDEYSDVEATDHPTSYIQAEPGQEYAIRVTLLEGFRKMKAINLIVELTIDGTPNNGKFEYREINDMPWKIGILQHEKIAKFIQYTDGFDKQRGQWRRYAFKFGHLAMSEDEKLPQGLRSDTMRQLGSIKVVVYRAGRLTPVRHSEHDPEDYWEIPDNLSSVPEKVLKGADINATTNYHPKAQTQRNDFFVKGGYLSGDAGREQHFTFLYRSKAALQRLDYLPRDRTPTPDPAPAIPEARSMTQAEVDELKAQIGRLQARLPTVLVKTESEERLSPDVKAEPEDRKRTRQEYDAEDDGSDIEEVAPPAKKRGPIIEISDDED
ncbi:uncharacterized protein AB675_9191 [Cyphellophora attinorum]|uniref:DUF7918 domain-containing protein n=1 Tax=Cyphellophora attinorum TaxID=1664694 RepID=A0A0N1HCK4_9EURO|nr:uncharacterized protein AB675_9191 [Phialophora attinorum]KPI41575.1 hypothetical protein AB675_9191 [Phialophora attinorum]